MTKPHTIKTKDLVVAFLLTSHVFGSDLFYTILMSFLAGGKTKSVFTIPNMQIIQQLFSLLLTFFLKKTRDLMFIFCNPLHSFKLCPLSISLKFHYKFRGIGCTCLQTTSVFNQRSDINSSINGCSCLPLSIPNSSPQFTMCCTRVGVHFASLFLT